LAQWQDGNVWDLPALPRARATRPNTPSASWLIDILRQLKGGNFSVAVIDTQINKKRWISVSSPKEFVAVGKAEMPHSHCIGRLDLFAPLHLRAPVSDPRLFQR
jgi:hypothetical protein